MNLADLIEKRRFVGREFLLWLWFESELREGRFDVEGFGACELFLEGQITLTQEKEQCRLKGAAPSADPEAHQALRQGKMPTQARLRLTRGELAYAFLFSADTLALSGVKIPAEVNDETDERFYERMYLLEDLEALLASLYGQFLGLRLCTAWETTVVPAMRAWIRGEAVDAAALRRLRVPPIGKPARPTTMAPPGMDGAGDDEREEAPASGARAMAGA